MRTGRGFPAGPLLFMAALTDAWRGGGERGSRSHSSEFIDGSHPAALGYSHAPR